SAPASERASTTTFDIALGCDPASTAPLTTGSVSATAAICAHRHRGRLSLRIPVHRSPRLRNPSRPQVGGRADLYVFCRDIVYLQGASAHQAR
ncbi:MAG: hypothetical protein M0038_16105, partial [Pseudomonadota bacterium]|nr:hypothetical protein [Pseudomonadota bacterium]